MPDANAPSTSLATAAGAIREQLPAAGKPSSDELVDRWFADSFQGSRLANETETWNLVFAAKEDLKRRLAAS